MGYNREEYKKLLLTKSVDELSELIINATIDKNKQLSAIEKLNNDYKDLENRQADIIRRLKLDTKELEGKLMEKEKEFNELATKTEGILKNWDKRKEQTRLDISDEEIKKRYLNGETVYKIAKDYEGSNVHMTIRNRLIKIGVYQGKKHNDIKGELEKLS